MSKKRRYLIKATVFDSRGRKLSTAINKYEKTHPWQAELAESVGLPKKSFLHAEVSAIIKAQKQGQPYKIKVERYLSDGTPANACPCKICQEAIRLSGIKVIEYTL